MKTCDKYVYYRIINLNFFINISKLYHVRMYHWSNVDIKKAIGPLKIRNMQLAEPNRSHFPYLMTKVLTVKNILVGLVRNMHIVLYKIRCDIS